MRLLLFFAVFCFQSAFAQVDPSSALLLDSSASTPSTGLQSGRYQNEPPDLSGTGEEPEVKPVEKKSSPVAVKKTKPVEKSGENFGQVGRRKPANPGGIPMAVISPKIRRWPTADEEKATEAAPPAATASEPENKSSAEPVPPAAEKKSPETRACEKESGEILPERGPLRIELALGAVHEEAASNSIYRGYSSTSSVAAIGGELWIRDDMGFAGRYETTLSADMASPVNADARVPFTQEWSELRWNFLRGGTGALATWTEYALIYFEQKLHVSSDETARVSLSSGGLGAAATLGIPVSKSYTWILGAALYPRLRHSENATALALESGSSPESSRLDLKIGGDLRLVPAKSWFWDLSLQLEKNQFGGTSNTNEPSGSPAENVSVLTSTAFFHLGYRWGH